MFNCEVMEMSLLITVSHLKVSHALLIKDRDFQSVAEFWAGRDPYTCQQVSAVAVQNSQLHFS